MHLFDQRLTTMGITLPAAAKPVANYAAFVQDGSIIHISGQLATSTKGDIKGIVGDDVSTETAVEAAKLCGINLAAQIKAACGGDWNRFGRIIRLGGYVQAGADFTDIPAVINGCSDFMVDLFGEHGVHARSAVGVYRLPFGFSVEVDAIFELKA